MKKRLKAPLIIVGVLVIAVVGLVTFKFFDMMQRGVNIITGEMVGEAAEMVEANKSAPNLELDYEDMFTDKDLEQVADMELLQSLALETASDVLIKDEGIYVVSGDYKDVMIVIEADDEAKVQLVLDDISIINESKPTIYVKSGDKVTITTTESVNELSVTSEYKADGDTNLDAVIFSKSDLIFNGLGSLYINSEQGNGISTKDDLKITGGTYTIITVDDGLEANDSIRIYDGNITITSSNDAMHCVNDEDDSLGYIYIEGGMINISSDDDAIRGNSAVVINGGEINVETCSEGLEASQIIVNDGRVNIFSTDDGLNATFKTAYRAVIEINGGIVNVTMANGDTDGFDSNGDFTMTGGDVNIEGGMAAFDIDGEIVFDGGNIIVDGLVQTEIVVQQIGIGLMFDK